MKKRIFSLIIVTVLMFTMAVPSFAASQINTESSASELILNDGSVLISEDLPNGDAKFTILKNGVVVAESYTYRSSGQIASIDYREETPTMAVLSIPNASSSQSVSPYASYYTYIGSITYNYYGGNAYVTGTRSLDVLRKTNTYTGSRYNVNGTYQNIASFASYLAGLLTLPSAVASSMAAGILGTLGILTNTISILIPDHYVRCNETEVYWKGRLSDATDVYATFGGSKFVLTQEGYENKTYYSGDYWASTSYSNHSSSFAVHLYYAVLGEDTLEIVSWT